jgi:hypothetical protein
MVLGLVGSLLSLGDVSVLHQAGLFDDCGIVSSQTLISLCQTTSIC